MKQKLSEKMLDLQIPVKSRPRNLRFLVALMEFVAFFFFVNLKGSFDFEGINLEVIANLAMTIVLIFYIYGFYTANSISLSYF